MKKRGFTLVELILALLLSSIMVLALCCQFVAMVRLSSALRDRIELTRDARFAAHMMASVIRVGKVAGAIGSDSAYINTANQQRMRFEVNIHPTKTSSLVPAAANRVVYNVVYNTGTADDNKLTCTMYAGSSQTVVLYYVLSDYCTFFNTDFASVFSKTEYPKKNMFLLQLKFTKNGVTVPIETRIQVFDN